MHTQVRDEAIEAELYCSDILNYDTPEISEYYIRPRFDLNYLTLFPLLIKDLHYTNGLPRPPRPATVVP